MIGQRLAVWGTALPAGRRANRAASTPPSTEAAARPAIAGRIHLLAFLQRSVLLQLMLAMALIAFAALIYLNQAGKESVLQLSISDLQRQQIQLNMRNGNLYAEATSLQGLARIETLATTQLHMIRPSQGSLTWIRPIVPRVAPLPPDTAGAAAQQRSQPLAWMQHAVQFLAAQL
jgi:cell division protein FtsL